MVLATTVSGETIELSEDTSLFGFPVNTVVRFTKSRYNGKFARVRGVHGGALWFSIFDAENEAAGDDALAKPVQTVSCRAKAELIRQYGWAAGDTAP